MWKRTRWYHVILLTILLGVMPVICQADEWYEQPDSNVLDTVVTKRDSGNGRVMSASRTNWEDGYIEVMAGATARAEETVNAAHAYSVALKTARHLAYEKLAEAISGVNVSSNATYDREILLDSNLKTQVKSLVRGALVVNESSSQFGDGSIWVEVSLGMHLYGNKGLIGPLTGRLKPVPSSKTPSLGIGSSADGYTGLIIDATGLGAKPAMLPEVKSASGVVLYDSTGVSREYILNMGLIGYQDSLQKAMQLPRVGKNPLIIRAAEVMGSTRSSLILSEDDARKIAEAIKKNDFLDECRVAVIIGG